MNLAFAYGRFAAPVNSLLLVLLFALLGGWGPANAQSPVKIAVLGDSLAAGYGIRPEQAFPVRLEAALKAQGRNVTVLNQGVSGDTTAGGLDRLDWMLADRPDIVLVELGGNDALRGIDPAATEKNLAAIVEKLQAAHVTVWLAGMMAPRNLGSDYVTAFDGLYKRIADKYKVPLYPFILDGVAQDPALNQADGLHPNPRGAQIVADKLLPFVTKNLDDAQAVHRSSHP
ncbi:MAG: arylesterase [Proteobacteria bacterium]|nr:arylesterase [Pseudomonadota bacterium]